MARDIRDRIRATLAEQRQLVARLLRLREQLAGSLFVRYGTCGKPACACRTEGRRHGPYYVLSTRSGGEGGFAYVDEGTARKARARVARYREFRAGLVALQKRQRQRGGPAAAVPEGPAPGDGPPPPAPGGAEKPVSARPRRRYSVWLKHAARSRG